MKGGTRTRISKAESISCTGTRLKARGGVQLEFYGRSAKKK